MIFQIGDMVLTGGYISKVTAVDDNVICFRCVDPRSWYEGNIGELEREALTRSQVPWGKYPHETKFRHQNTLAAYNEHFV